METMFSKEMNRRSGLRRREGVAGICQKRATCAGIGTRA